MYNVKYNAMKNKMQKATFVALLVLSFVVQGQSSLYSTHFFTPQINKTIVREVASARMINYVETPTLHYFGVDIECELQKNKREE